MAAKISVAAANELNHKDFIKTFGNVVEKTSLCAAAVISRRPFASFDNLYGAMCGFIDELPEYGQEGILRNLPDLADRLDSLSTESLKEQTQAGITSLSSEETKQLKHCNGLYKTKFGFPFVICARLNKKDAILDGIKIRLKNDREEELKCGIEEVKKIMFLRMKDLVEYEDSKL